ncbi:MAG: ABC transporter permease subunit [Dehalococcoidia bacterium]|nr:ABC transporter permease subunit [Dehalococcoidia bacterium]
MTQELAYRLGGAQSEELPRGGPGALRRLASKPLGVIGLVIVVGLIVLMFVGPSLMKHDYDTADPVQRLEGPSWEHPFGTDNLGRDVLSRMVWGTRISIAIGFGSVALALVVATTIGLLSGYVGGWIDTVLQRLVDVWMSFPGLILALTLVTMFGAGYTSLLIAIGLVLGGAISRVVRSAALSTRDTDYVQAARVLGAGPIRLLLRHVLPNIVPVLIVLASVQVGSAILLEATVSFLGYGVPPPEPSWGSMLAGDARSFMLQQPLLSLWPGIAIFLAVYGFNMLGDALRDVLDPRLRGA